MPDRPGISRRRFVAGTSALLLGARGAQALVGARADAPLTELSPDAVELADGPARHQFEETHRLLMALDEDSLLKPLRQMSGLPAPGIDLGGWYHYDPNYDFHWLDAGFAPSATFGQWLSALSRAYAIGGDQRVADKVRRLVRGYAATISARYFEDNRFPAYCYDKLVGGLVDAHQWVDPQAFAVLERTTEVALPHLPGRAIPHGQSWRPGTDESYTWDESYTISENLFKAYAAGAGQRYHALATQYLAGYLFDPLAAGVNALAGCHAYSHVNALGSAMAAYLTDGDPRHLAAARHGFEIVAQQSYANGGWGPDEQLRALGSEDLAESLTHTHHSFEAPCGTYAHTKLTRALLRVTRESIYGDSAERVLWNAMFGALPMQADGRTFYYADCSSDAHKVYSDHRWPCCAGTMPMVAAEHGRQAFLRDGDALYVVQYLPGTVRWRPAGAQASLMLAGDYPFSDHVAGELRLSRPTRFTLAWRIPAWAQGARIEVNGRLASHPEPGAFAHLTRQWRDGDRIDVQLPLALRLEPLDGRHPERVAVLRGPLVLLAERPMPARPTRAELLAARPVGARRWQVDTAEGPMRLLPDAEVTTENYAMYVEPR